MHVRTAVPIVACPEWLRLGCVVGLCYGAFAAVANAQTDEIQVYDAQIAASGQFTLDWHNNYTPSASHVAAFDGGVAPDGSLQGVSEWAYGVRPWFEAGLYFPLYTLTSSNALLYDGFKLRALFVSPDAAHRDVFYGMNFEFSFNTAHWNVRRYTSEIRPIVGTHIGRFDLIFNPIVDNSYTGVANFEFVPATRLAMAVGQRAKVALEEYDDFGRVSHFLPASQQSHQLFAVFDYATRWFDLEAGIGAGLNPGSEHRVLKLIIMKDLTPRASP